MPFTTREIESTDPVTRVVAAELHHTDDDIGEKMVLNMGPSHPATHGVLRLVLELDGRLLPRRHQISVSCIEATRKSPRTCNTTSSSPTPIGSIILPHFQIM